MEKQKKLSVRGATLTRDDRYVDIEFSCLGGERGGCALNQRRRVVDFVRPFFQTGNGNLDITQGGFACSLARDAVKANEVAPEGCRSEPSLLLRKEPFDDAVEVIQHPNGTTTFKFR